MHINILCVGKIKEKYFTSAADEYIKRLGRFAKISVIEIPDEKIPQNASEKEENLIKITEGKKILSKIGSEFTIAMCIEGTQLSSIEFSDRISDIMQYSPKINFIIGGSLGLSDEVKSRADLKLSFGAVTLPHQLMRIVLLEQIYRAFKIISHETYHK